jgi:hypothetical protein
VQHIDKADERQTQKTKEKHKARDANYFVVVHWFLLPNDVDVIEQPDDNRGKANGRARYHE